VISEDRTNDIVPHIDGVVPGDSINPVSKYFESLEKETVHLSANTDGVMTSESKFDFVVKFNGLCEKGVGM
jgi:hypothetical protein